MKLIILLAAVAGLFLTSGCEEHEHHYHPYGGAYDGYYHGYGYGYHYDGDWDHDHWEHH